MAINKYDQPAQAQFMNTYVPIPFEEMMQAGKMKQDRYDKVSGAMDSTIASLDEMPAIPGSDDERRMKEYALTARLIRDKYNGKDLSDPFVTRDLSNEISKSINKEDIKHIQQSHQGWVGYNKELGDNEQRGVPTPKSEIQNFTGYDSSGKQGVFSGHAPTYKNPAAELDQFFKPLEPTMKDSFREMIDGKPTGYISNLLSIDKNDIAKYVKDNFSTLMAGPAMKQVIKEAVANGDTRKPEEIALSYVNQNSANRIKSGPGTFREDKSMGTAGNGIDPGALREPETHGLTGVKEAKPLSTREIDREIAKMEQTIFDNPKDQTTKSELEQIYLVRKFAGDQVQQGENRSPNQKIEYYKKEGKTALLSSAVVALMNNGLTNEQATDFIIKNSNRDLWSTTNQDESIELRAEAIKNNIGSFVKKASGKMGKFMLNNPLNVVDARVFIPGIMKQLDELENTEGTKSNGQILLNYTNGIKDLNKKVEEQEKVKAQAEDDAYNKLKPYQSTYTMLEGMYKYDNGVLKGSFIDKNNNEKPYYSPLAKITSDVLYNMPNYQHQFFDEKNEPLSKADLSAKQEILNNSKDFMIVGVDDAPTERDGAMVTVSLTKTNKDGKVVPFGGKFKVEIPMGYGDNSKYIGDELIVRNQFKTAFSLQNYQRIKQAVNTTPVFKGGEISLKALGQEDATPEDKITFNVVGAGLVPVLHWQGKTKNMTDGPVPYKQLPGYIIGFLQRTDKRTL